MRIFRPRKSLMTTNDNDNDNIVQCFQGKIYTCKKKSKKGSQNSKTAKVMLYICNVKIEAEFLRPS